MYFINWIGVELSFLITIVFCIDMNFGFVICYCWLNVQSCHYEWVQNAIILWMIQFMITNNKYTISFCFLRTEFLYKTLTKHSTAQHPLCVSECSFTNAAPLSKWHWTHCGCVKWSQTTIEMPERQTLFIFVCCCENYMQVPSTRAWALHNRTRSPCHAAEVLQYLWVFFRCSLFRTGPPRLTAIFSQANSTGHCVSVKRLKSPIKKPSEHMLQQRTKKNMYAKKEVWLTDRKPRYTNANWTRKRKRRCTER